MGIAMYTHVPFDPHQIKQSFLENISRTQRHKYIRLFYGLLSAAIYGTRGCLCSGSEKSGQEAGSVNAATCAPGDGGWVPREMARGEGGCDPWSEPCRPRRGGARAPQRPGGGVTCFLLRLRGEQARRACAAAPCTGEGGFGGSSGSQRGLGDTHGPGPRLGFKETGFRRWEEPQATWERPSGTHPSLGVVWGCARIFCVPRSLSACATPPFGPTGHRENQ